MNPHFLDDVRNACENGDHEGVELLFTPPSGERFRDEGYFESFRDDDTGDTVMHSASRSGNAELVTFLCEAGGSINMKNDARQLPLHIACKLGHAEVVEAIINTEGYMYIGTPDVELSTPLHYAVESGKSQMVSMILSYQIPGTLNPLPHRLNAPRSDGKTPLHMAAHQGNESIVRDLVLKGAVVNCVEEHGCTPLHFSCVLGDDRSARILVANGADRSITNRDGKTPGQLAIDNGHRYKFMGITPSRN